MITQNPARHTPYTHGPVTAARHSVRNAFAQMHTIAQLSGQLAGELGGSDTDLWRAIAVAMTHKTPDEKESYLLSLLAASREIDELVPRTKALAAQHFTDLDGVRMLFNMKLERICDENPVWLPPVRDAWAELVRDIEHVNLMEAA